MSFTSFYYFVLIAVLICLYYVLPKRTQIYLLLLGSIIFMYYAGGKRTLRFVFISTLTTFVSANIISGKSERRYKNCAFIVAVLINIAALAIFKYVNFFVNTANDINCYVLHNNIRFDGFSIIPPLGISFYTLQVLGYLIDVKRGTIKAQTNIFKYALFAGFFPQLVTGPINRYENISESLYRYKNFDYKTVCFGLQRILWGLFKKLVIAERMAVLVNSVYDNYGAYSGFYIIFATLCFAIQLYTDFSGAIDIALGTAECFGIRMEENFRQPFFSKSLSQFWRRWHITLGAWMKDYVFYPILKTDMFVNIGTKARVRLGKKLGKKIPVYIGMIILWFTVGFWHGGEWKYIIGSGLLHCFFIVTGELLEPIWNNIKKVTKANTECFSWRLFQSVRTFCLVCLGFIFFRSGSVNQAFRMIKKVITVNISELLSFSPFGLGLDKYDLLIGILSIIVIWSVSMLQQKGSVREAVARQNLPFRWLLYYGLIFAILIFGFYGEGYDPSEFIYERF